MAEVESRNVEAEKLDVCQNICHPSQILLLRMSKWYERTIVLDLDNTLVNATLSRPPNYDFTIAVRLNDEQTLTYYVQRRFGINLLFFYLKVYKYEIIIFTSASKDYADAILKGFNVNGSIDHCLYRDSCSSVLGRCMKDLRKLGRDMKKIFIVDDCPDCYQLQPQNGFHVKPFFGSPDDRELMRVVDVARKAAQCEDVREALIRFSEIERVREVKQERESVTLRKHNQIDDSKMCIDIAQPRDRERNTPEVDICRNQPKAKVKKYSKINVGRFQPEEVASKNSKGTYDMAKCKEKKRVIMKTAGKCVQSREQERWVPHGGLGKVQRREPQRRLSKAGIVEIHPNQLNKRTSNIGHKKVERKRRNFNSNSGIANIEPITKNGKDRCKQPLKQTFNVGVLQKEYQTETPEYGIQCIQVEKKTFTADRHGVQPDEPERERSEVGKNSIQTRAVQMETSHVVFVAFDDNFQHIEPERDNLNVIEQETFKGRGSQNTDIVISENFDSETSKTKLIEGDDMKRIEQKTSLGSQNTDMVMLEKICSEASIVSLDMVEPIKKESKANIDGLDGCNSDAIQLNGEESCRVHNDSFHPIENKLESSNSMTDRCNDSIQPSESKGSVASGDSPQNISSKDKDNGNCIDGVDMINQNEVEQGTFNVSIHSFQTSDSEAAETCNSGIHSFETGVSEVDSWKTRDSEIIEALTENLSGANHIDPDEEDSTFDLDIVYHKQQENETSIFNQQTEQRGESPKSSLPFKSSKKTIVLDLEGTLIKSSISYCTLPSYDFFVDFKDLPVSKYVLKRPGTDEFLSRLAKNYELVVFTESPRETTESILDKIDINNHITWRFYGDTCKYINGNSLVKDLSVLGKDLGSVLIIDDNPLCYSRQPQNAVAIKSFEGKLDDRELYKLLPFCESLHNCRDVRTAIMNNH